jgi:hypothetical protein
LLVTVRTTAEVAPGEYAAELAVYAEGVRK